MPKIVSGNHIRVPNQGEKLNKQNLGRSFFFNKNMKVGEVIKHNHLEYKSPFIGVGIKEAINFIGKPIAQICKRGDVLSPSLLSEKLFCQNKR